MLYSSDASDVLLQSISKLYDKKNIGTSPLTRKQVKPEDSFVADHSLLCSHSASYDDFSILTRQNKKFLLESKESLLIMRDKSSLNKNITSAPLHFFDRA